MKKAIPLIELYVDNKTVGNIRKGTKLTLQMAAQSANKNDLSYMDHKEIRALDTDEFLDMAVKRRNVFTKLKALGDLDLAALSGEVVAPLTFMEALERYWSLTPERFVGVTEYKAKLKKNRDRKPVTDFIERMGDVDILKLKLKDCNEYRAKLIAACVAKELKSEQATWRISKLREIIREVYDNEFPERENPFMKVKPIDLKDGSKHQPFTEIEIDKVNAELLTANLSDEAKGVITVAQMTGAIASEIGGLLPEDIFVDAELPHIIIRPNRIRQLKTDSRPRTLPLFGAMLEVFQRYPNGFTSYQDDRGWQRLNRNLSDFFKRVTPGKSMYSNRHRIEDCLKAVRIDGGVRSEIKGHSTKGMSEFYGTNRDILDIKEILEKALTEGAAKKRDKERRMSRPAA
ncbi:hypothetical protein C8J36_101122 [Rhizobium sp. PP-F2F-G48]|uniref:hypothetical protein n=1 Tax=Rhizobium sp. PP-F2F-G48 TaxID=2135651 RepID=UPI00105145AE|nr:hypothetical protein [Rhizobium sp. PP-F2F-G48]TCM58223.1 hypothetical protein C8J36_101122 [Rhizobium sp. PP-F2F-G48]